MARQVRQPALAFDAGAQALQGGLIFLRTQVANRHRKKLVTGVPILLHRDSVDVENAPRLRIRHPHGQRIVLEQQSVAILGATQLDRLLLIALQHFLERVQQVRAEPKGQNLHEHHRRYDRQSGR